jgi:hypothetical protein
VPQVVAIKAEILVRRILQPPEAALLRVRFQIRAGDVDERSDQPSGSKRCGHTDTGETGRAAAPHEVQQQRLGLVVAVMSAE